MIAKSLISLCRALLVAGVLAFLNTAFAWADSPTADELSQQAANPIADLMSIPFQNNTDYGLGIHDRAINVLNIQPVVPFADGKWITRTIVPFVWIPDLGAQSGRLSSGLSDISFTAFHTLNAGTVTWDGPVQNADHEKFASNHKRN